MVGRRSRDSARRVAGDQRLAGYGLRAPFRCARVVLRIQKLADRPDRAEVVAIVREELQARG
jgi:hypothetical protein